MGRERKSGVAWDAGPPVYRFWPKADEGDPLVAPSRFTFARPALALSGHTLVSAARQLLTRSGQTTSPTQGACRQFENRLPQKSKVEFLFSDV